MRDYKDCQRYIFTDKEEVSLGQGIVIGAILGIVLWVIIFMLFIF